MSVLRRLLCGYGPIAVLAVVLGSPAGAAPTKQACREACEAANVLTSCAWLTPKPGRCTRAAVRACLQRARAGQPVACEPTEDFPACLTNRGCPYGTLCTDGRCQVVACGAGDPASCSGDRTCLGEQCVVADCRGSDQNCPDAFHCAPAGLGSGTCVPVDPNRRACTSDTDCIAAGDFNPRCLRGVCAARKRRRACEADADCFPACRKGGAAARLGYCDAAGRCVCANCESQAQCAARFSCESGQAAECRPNGSCRCPGSPSSGGRGVCTTFETPACTPCDTDAHCSGIDRCLQSASCG